MNNIATNPRIYANQQPPTPPPPAPAPGPEEVYQAVDSILVAAKEAMNQNPAEAREQLKAMSSEVKSTFKDDLVGLSTLPQTSEDGRQLALNALAAGMLAGALDGAVLLHADAGSQAAKPAAAQAQPDGIGEEIGKAVDKIFEELQQRLEAAKEKLKEMGANGLQSASAHGKDLGCKLVGESDRLVGANKIQTQGFMASAFSLGYALGGTDAAIVMVANQVPGQPQ